MEEGAPPTAQMSFDNPDDLHDIVFVVDGKKFYCSKIDLAKQSEYFKSMLFGKFDESAQAEIKLNDTVTPEQFEAFLMVINAIKYLNDENVEGVLWLCDQWQAPIAKDRCSEFLMKDSKMTHEDRFNLAVQFGLDTLKTKILSEFMFVEQLHRIIPEDHSHWDPDTTKMVFDKILDLTGYKSPAMVLDQLARRRADEERPRHFIFQTRRH